MRLKRMKAHKKDIFSRWLISGMPGFCFGSDKELYRLPFVSNNNYYGIRKLKKQEKDRWKINGKWWSKRQLYKKIYLNPNPELIVKGEEMPFDTNL